MRLLLFKYRSVLGKELYHFEFDAERNVTVLKQFFYKFDKQF